MEKFEVCFRLEDDNSHVPFNAQSSIIPAYLPEKPEDDEKNNKENDPELKRFKKHWLSDPLDDEIEIERILGFNQVPLELVTRYFARLGQKAKSELMWRYDMIIELDTLQAKITSRKSTRAWLHVDAEMNQFVVSLRGFDRESCNTLIDKLIKEIESLCENYPGVNWQQYARSPHHRKGLIRLEDLISEMSQEIDDTLKPNNLICPKTGLPVHIESSLHKVGLIDAMQVKYPIFKGD